MSTATRSRGRQAKRVQKATPKWTFGDYLALAPEALKCELHDGEMLIMSPPSGLHEELQSWLLSVLRVYVDSRKLGVVVGSRYAIRVTQERGYEPDILFVTRARAHLYQDDYLHGPPDLAVEVVSPDSRAYDLGAKLRAYEESGVREYWVLDPYRREAHFCRLCEGKLLEAGVSNDTYESEVVPGFRLRLAWLWHAAGEFPNTVEVLRELGAF